MKQIIMDLADKAIEDMPKMRWEIPDEFCEKFAELIVRECGDVAYGAYWDNPETVRGQHIKEKIKQHFGVEK
jgi:hypothetical protein